MATRSAASAASESRGKGARKALTGSAKEATPRRTFDRGYSSTTPVDEVVNPRPHEGAPAAGAPRQQ